MKLELVQAAYKNITNKYLALSQRIHDKNLTDIVFSPPEGIDIHPSPSDDPNKYDILFDIESLLLTEDEALEEPGSTTREPETEIAPPHDTASVSSVSCNSSPNESLI